jgi:hexulose-6-phosphate isomerase
MIGFMQGRLSARVDGKIQAFPWSSWREEFSIAEKLGFPLMEWTLDQNRLHENPLMTAAGRAEIRSLCHRHRLSILSLTGDCFMQAPFWKASGNERERLQSDFCSIVDACSQIGIRMIVVPLVDLGSLEYGNQEDILVNFLKARTEFLMAKGVTVIFECDYPPAEIARFIGRLDTKTFGINYDIGNSAALGFSPTEEFQAYGDRILNVHVKDRPFHGTTVPLGEGDADFIRVFAELARVKYDGDFILQTARADADDHATVLCRYRAMTKEWLTQHAT